MTEADERFDDFLRQALGPPARDEDQAFAAKVAATAMLEARLDAQRTAAVRRAVRDALAIIALGAAAGSVAGAPSVAAFVAGNQALALGALMLLFLGWSALLVRPDSQPGISG